MMARPRKNNCDYFPHDANLRNDRRMKALKTEHGIDGYAIYLMLLEVMTDAEFCKIKYDDDELILIAGDFGCNIEKLEAVIEFLHKLKLITIDDNFLFSESLQESLKPVFEQREYYRNK